MIKRLIQWWRFKQLNWASRLVDKYGYMVVRMHLINGVTYIRANDGSLHRIGRK